MSGFSLLLDTDKLIEVVRVHDRGSEIRPLDGLFVQGLKPLGLRRDEATAEAQSADL